ncbi:MAG TPA: ATP-binding protein [Chitinophagaceae bacterium]
MTDSTRKQLRIVTVVFWAFLFYIVAALGWWLISLEQQNKNLHELRRHELSIQSLSTADNNAELERIRESEKRNSVKYIAEGITFFLLIFFGAVYIWRLIKKQFFVQLQQQNFMMAVTHELKTPLAVARLNLETLQKHQLDPEKQKRVIDMTLQETLRLDTLINNILISSQFEGGAYRAVKEELDLSELTEEVFQQFHVRYPHRKVISEIEHDIDMNGDPLLMKLLISNLLENANKYSPKEQPVELKLSKKNNKITLQVTDQGWGISDEEKEMVFEKFYRAGREETRTTKGTGLGLYICKKIAENHNGSITIKDNEPQGSIFTVTFSL